MLNFPIDVDVDEIYISPPASHIHYQYDPGKTKTRTYTARSTCWPGEAKEKRKFVRLSQSEIFGDPTVHPQKEETATPTVNPIGHAATDYDEAKPLAERFFTISPPSTSSRIKSTRNFQPYGPA